MRDAGKLDFYKLPFDPTHGLVVLGEILHTELVLARVWGQNLKKADFAGLEKKILEQLFAVNSKTDNPQMASSSKSAPAPWMLGEVKQKPDWHVSCVVCLDANAEGAESSRACCRATKWQHSRVPSREEAARKVSCCALTSSADTPSRLWIWSEETLQKR